MRQFLLCTLFLLVSCDKAQPDPHVIVVRVREPQRINGCNVYIDSTHDDHVRGKPRRNAYMQTICGVPESTLKGQWWWGEGPQPPGFAIEVGDCMPLDNIYYCLEDVVHYESAKFRATYEKPDQPKATLQRIR